MMMSMAPSISSPLIYLFPPRPRTTYLSHSLATLADSTRIAADFFFYTFSLVVFPPPFSLESRFRVSLVSSMLSCPFRPSFSPTTPFCIPPSRLTVCVCVCVYFHLPLGSIPPFSRSPSLVFRFMAVLSERTDTGMCNFSLKVLPIRLGRVFQSSEPRTDQTCAWREREREAENCAGSCIGKRSVCGGAKCEGKRDRDSHQGCLRLSFKERLPVSACAIYKMGRGALPAQCWTLT